MLLAPFCRHIYARFCDADQWVVPYHPAVLLAWQAHMNIQAVTATAWSFYVLKYAAKMQLPSNISLAAEALHTLGLEGISEQQARLASAVVLSRPVCPCEAAHILSGEHIITHTVDVTYIDTRPPSMRSFKVVRRGHANQYGVSLSALATYCARPYTEECEDLTLLQYFKSHEVRAALGQLLLPSPHAGCLLLATRCLLHAHLDERCYDTCSIQHGFTCARAYCCYLSCLMLAACYLLHWLHLCETNCCPACCLAAPAQQVRPKSNKSKPNIAARDAVRQRDGLGQHVWKLAEERVTRGPNISPKSLCGGFYYNILLDNLSFRHEHEVLPEDGDFFLECVRQGIFKTTDDLDKRLQAYNTYNMHSTATLDKLRGGVEESMDTVLHALGAFDPEDADAHGPAAVLAGAEAMEQDEQQQQEQQDLYGGTDDDEAPDPGSEDELEAATPDTAQQQHLEAEQLNQQRLRAGMDPIQRMRAAMDAGHAITNPHQANPDTLARLKEEAMKRCHPTISSPLDVEYDDLSAEQQGTINAVLKALRDNNHHVSLGQGTSDSKPIVIVIQGGPGTGKSAITRILVQLAVEAGHATLVTATSATAANRLQFSHTDTVDGACQLPVNSRLSPLRTHDAGTLAMQLAALLVCDEFSMMSQAKLALIMSRMSQSTLPGEPRKILLLVGDLAQLPSVCRHGKRQRGRKAKRSATAQPLCALCHLLRCPIYRDPATTHHNLNAVYRQASDEEFGNFLHAARVGRPTQALIDQVLGGCFRPADSLAGLLAADATVLCTHR